MGLTSADSKDLDNLAELPNKVMEVATPVISSVFNTAEIDQLCSEIGDLKQLVQSLLPSKTPNTDDPFLMVVHPGLPHCNL